MKYLSIVLFCLITLSFTSKSNYGIRKIWLFSQQQNAGIMQVDDKGNEVGKRSWQNHFFVLEVDSFKPVLWDSVVIDNKSYALSNQIIKGKKLNIGRLSGDENFLAFYPNKNRKLVKVVIQNCETELLHNTSYQFILIGQRNGKRITYSFSKKNKVLQPLLAP